MKTFAHRVSRGILIALPAAALLAAPVAYAACTAGSTSGGLQNPLCFGDIQSFIAGALKALVQIAVPIIAIFIVYSGFLFVSARGNEKQLSDAKRNFVYVIIGALLILGAWELSQIIGGTVTQLTSG